MPDNPPDTIAGEGDAQTKRPTLDVSFEKLLREVAKFDEEQVKGWKEDIDTLLVFAGLFSAVVTAFLIEAYQLLEEDPADKTVTLLETLVSLQQSNGSQITATTPFTPDASTIRINCFWLLSLILSLTSALFGLLCKQWIREYQREPPTNTPGEALALRQLRRDSFEKWGVPNFLSALPILLETALLLFFAGILDLLWGLHRIPFIVSLIAIGLSAGLYFITTLLPTVTIPKDFRTDIFSGNFERLSYQFVCPYKSPQAWMLYRFVCKVLRPLSEFWTLPVDDKPVHALRYHIESPASDWSSFDLRVVRQYDQHVKDNSWSILFSLQVYQLRAFEWAITMFRDSPLMVPHLQNVLETMPPSVAMSAVLGHWDVALWFDVLKRDVDVTARDPVAFQQRYPVFNFPPLPTSPKPAICQSERIRFLFKHQLLMTSQGHDDFRAALERMGVQTTGFHFVIPLSVTGRLWAHQDADVQRRSLALLRLYEESWKACSSVENVDDNRHLFERIAFISAFARHIKGTDRTSVLITSKQGQEFIRFIHNQIITQGLYRISSVRSEWSKVIIETQEGGNLPSDYFASLPYENHPPCDSSSLPSIRYSLEHQPDVEVNQAQGSPHNGEKSRNDDVLDVRTVGNPTTVEDRAVDPGSSSAPRRGHTTMLSSDGPLVDSDVINGDERGLGINLGDARNQYTPSQVLPEIASSPSRLVEADGDKQGLGSAHVELNTQDPDMRTRGDNNTVHFDNLDSRNSATTRASVPTKTTPYP
ncbi:hypothetical protein VNI00_010798 [Paramarasmius palmivorus]|uniref:DUF6535 domain-containing protein n=1 Tax=Paramarasmius palmivorus TaxID=297713 RepID=A0AAW0CDN9_9AGAR